jgi:hypothetical protein
MGNEDLAKAANRIRFDDEGMIADIAGDLADEAIGRGEKVTWPPGVSRETASTKTDFPANLWKKAQDRWNQLSPKERQEQARQRALLALAMSEKAKKPEFGEFFAPWDLLWFALAIVSAYKVGTGSYGSE